MGCWDGEGVLRDAYKPPLLPCMRVGVSGGVDSAAAGPPPRPRPRPRPPSLGSQLPLLPRAHSTLPPKSPA